MWAGKDRSRDICMYYLRLATHLFCPHPRVAESPPPLPPRSPTPQRYNFSSCHTSTLNARLCTDRPNCIRASLDCQRLSADVSCKTRTIEWYYPTIYCTGLATNVRGECACLHRSVTTSPAREPSHFFFSNIFLHIYLLYTPVRG